MPATCILKAQKEAEKTSINKAEINTCIKEKMSHLGLSSHFFPFGTFLVKRKIEMQMLTLIIVISVNIQL